MIRRKSYFNENECNNTCHAFAHHANTKPTAAAEEETDTTLNDSNDFDSNNNNTNDDDINNDSDITHTNRLSNEVTDEMDNISLEVLWDPQNNGKPTTADIVFIHGLHGK